MPEEDACCCEELDDEEEGGWVYVDWGRPGWEPYLHLLFNDHTIGKNVTLRLGADGNPLSPAEQHAQVKRPLELVKAAVWFFAQRSPVYKRPRQPPLTPFGFIFAEYSPLVPVRVMFGCVATACQRLATAPAEMHVATRTAWRWATCVMDRVTQGRVRNVHQTLASLQAAAAARVAGEPSIFNAAGTGNGDLVFYHLVADLENAKRRNENSRDQETVLHWAARGWCGLEVCRWLLQCNADPFKWDESCHPALDYAALADRIDVCQLLLRCNSEAETLVELRRLLSRGTIGFIPHSMMPQLLSYGGAL